jgi:HemX protein
LLHVIDVLLPLLYLGLLVNYIFLFFRDSAIAHRLSKRLLPIVSLGHLALMILKAVLLDRLPMATPLEFLSALTLALILIYGILEWRYSVKQTGFVVIALAFLFQFISSTFSTFGDQGTVANTVLGDAGYAGHAVLILLAYAALSTAFLYSMLYLIQTRQLTQRRFGLFYRRLPPLDLLERMSVGAVKLGVPLLLGALVTGHLWMNSLMRNMSDASIESMSQSDPKIISAWATFVIYGIGLIGNRFWGWRGRRMGFIAIFAFLFVIIATGLVQHFLPSFHNFREGAML